ncbi:hypothetical protein BGZ98_009340 [Dissophora globulifera]|nr:hypothetical protein BGZ98_009340 [Dissophora globulifera]
MHRSYFKDDPRAQRLAQKLNILIGLGLADALNQKYVNDVNTFFSNFWKGTYQYVNIGRVAKLAQLLQQDPEQERILEAAIQQNHSISPAQKSSAIYVDYVRRDQACRFDGGDVMLQRNVADEKTGAFGKHSIDDLSKRGQSTSESQMSRTVLMPEIVCIDKDLKTT